MIQLDNTFRVSLPVEQTWKLLMDLPRVATCLPGAHLDAVVDGEYRGGLSTKIGPINARYQGVASFTELDEVAYRAVISARGKEEKGTGSATATVTATLTPHGVDATQVHVATNMAISGRAAQFGRSLLAEVSATLVTEFVRRLEAMIHGGDTAGAPLDDSVRPVAGGIGTDANTLDLATVALPLLRRAALPIIVGTLSGIVGILIGRSAGRRARRLATWHPYDSLPPVDGRRC